MLDGMRRIHAEIEALLGAHEQLTRAPLPDVAAIVAMQLKLAKANRDRKARVDKIYARLETVSDRARDHVRQLREDDRQIRARASQIIGDWPAHRIAQDWADYQKTAIATRRWNRQRMALEETLLFPLLIEASAP